MCRTFIKWKFKTVCETNDDFIFYIYMENYKFQLIIYSFNHDFTSSVLNYNLNKLIPFLLVPKFLVM